MKLVIAVLAGIALAGGWRARSAPPPDSFVAIDTWRTIPGQRARYLAFLDSNWVPARAAVAGSGDVVGFRSIVLDSAAAAKAGWDVMLMTTYRDSTAWARREEVFAPVLARRGLIRIDGMGPRELATFVWEAHGSNTREYTP
jgi:hypothetical protein